jgi:DNA-binding response OmpR family regulator
MEESAPRDEPQVLVVEDHPRVAESLRRRLSKEGYRVTTTGSGDDGCHRACTGAFDLIVLDLMVRGRRGFDVLAEIRDAGVSTPVLVLTTRDSLTARVSALDVGADDFLVKPFALAELAARARALVRRARLQDIRRLVIADLQLDLLTRHVARSGRSIELAPREFELLAYLVSHAGHVVSRDMLGREVWVQLERGTPLDNVIDVHIGRLRRKIDRGFDFPLIHTVRGLGFTVRRRPAG